MKRDNWSDSHTAHSNPPPPPPPHHSSVRTILSMRQSETTVSWYYLLFMSALHYSWNRVRQLLLSSTSCSCQHCTIHETEYDNYSSVVPPVHLSARHYSWDRERQQQTGMAAAWTVLAVVLVEKGGVRHTTCIVFVQQLLLGISNSSPASVWVSSIQMPKYGWGLSTQFPSMQHVSRCFKE